MTAHIYRISYTCTNLESGNVYNCSKLIDSIVNPHRLIDNWNRQQPKKWRYQFVEIDLAATDLNVYIHVHD